MNIRKIRKSNRNNNKTGEKLNNFPAKENIEL